MAEEIPPFGLKGEESWAAAGVPPAVACVGAPAKSTPTLRAASTQSPKSLHLSMDFMAPPMDMIFLPSANVER